MMPTWVRAAVALVAAVIVGLVLGIAGDRWWAARTARQTASSGDGTAAFVTQLDRAVGLDSVQRRVVTQILRRRQSVVDSAWRTMRPSVHAAIDSAQMEIWNVLRPAQRQAFVRWVGAVHARAGVGPLRGVSP